MFLPTLLFSLAALCCEAQLRTHKCVHHHLHIDLPDKNTRSVQVYGTNAKEEEPTVLKQKKETKNVPLKSTSRRRRLAKSNMRIHTEFSSTLAASTASLDVNIRAWTDEAVTFWQSALKVEQVTTLSFALTCMSIFNGPWGDGSTTTQCASYASTEQCNAGETIPSTWFQSGRACTSCLPSSPSSCTGCTDIAAGSGLANKDYAILVTAKDTTTCQASPSTLGYASPCKYDQFDRPILGHINYCPLAMATSQNIAVAAAKHELAHALGFTSGTFAYFHDPTTLPLAPRTTRDAAGTPPSSSKICADGNTRTVVTPSTNTLLGPMTIRNFPHGYKIATPNVVKAAKEHFNCPTQDGMELENQPTSAAGSCWGSHWEQRALHTELMTPVTDESSVVSKFTLGFFEDTGWYEADYTKAESLPWGKNKGCNFLSDTCNTGTKSSPTMMLQNEGYFCNEAYVSSSSTTSTATMTGCSHNGQFKSYCSLTTYSAPLPSTFQHFSNNKNGGSLAELDYCPIYAGFSNGDCSDTAHQSANNVNYYGDLYGSTSKCVRGTMIHTGYTVPSNLQSTCAAVVCSAGKLTLTLKDSSGGSQVVTCLAAEKGTGKTLTNFLGQVICPDFKVYCPSSSTFVSWYKNQTVISGGGTTNGSPTGGESSVAGAPAPSSSSSQNDGLGKENLPARGDAVMASVSPVVMCVSLIVMCVIGMLK